jgi:hypothetical protein
MILEKINQIIQDYVEDITAHLVHCKFFIYNPYSKVYGYKF